MGVKNLKPTISLLSHRNFVTFFIVTLVIQHIHAASVIHKREVVQSNRVPAMTCVNDDPCGWEVYDPATRNHAYYVTSSCVCPTAQKCVMKTDDLAINAYVYTCRVLPPRKNKSRSRTAGRQAPTVAATS